MGFIYPEALWLYLLLIPMLVVWTFVSRMQEKRLTGFIVRDNWQLLNPWVSARARFHKGVLILLALSFSILAAARPYWGERERELQPQGVNMIFAIDVSKSMLARDAGDALLRTSDGELPTRLSHAKTLVRQIMAEARGHRVGILPFAGDAFLMCPLTPDYGVAMSIARQVDTNIIAYQGTDFVAMLDTAIDAFDRSGGGARVLIVLTDGEDHSERLQRALSRTQDAGIRVFALGIGTTDGAPIILPDGTFKEDAQGHKILTRMDPETLRIMASATGGRAYAPGSNGLLDPDPVIRDLNNLEREQLNPTTRTVKEERYQWPLGLALFCLMLEMVLHDRRRHPVQPRKPNGGKQ